MTDSTDTLISIPRATLLDALLLLGTSPHDVPDADEVRPATIRGIRAALLRGEAAAREKVTPRFPGLAAPSGSASILSADR